MVARAGDDPACAPYESAPLTSEAERNIESNMDVPAGAAPAHRGFADRCVPVSPRHDVWQRLLGSNQSLPVQSRASVPLDQGAVGQGGWIPTTDLLLPRQAGTGRLPYTLTKWSSRQESNLHTASFVMRCSSG